jgi:hypothetical protein
VSEEHAIFTVSWHAESQEPDFIVLTSRVRASLEFGWEKEMAFKTYFLIEKQWFTGTISNVFTNEYPDSPWEVLQIQW